MSTRSSLEAVVLVPVGPGAEDEHGLVDLIDSLHTYEPSLDTLVVIDDGRGQRDLTTLARGRVRMIVLRNPRAGRGQGGWGGLCAGVIHGLRWIHEHLDVRWIVKLDVDALVIAPFAERLTAVLAAHPEAGLVGCVGETSNRAEELFQWCFRRPSRFAIALDMMNQLTADHFGGQDKVTASVPGTPQMRVDISRQQFEAFPRIRGPIERAIANGWGTAEYCQGGAYAIAQSMLEAMASAGFLDDPIVWTQFPFGEDETMAMYCRGLGLDIVDFSDRDQPFGVRYKDLPDEPAALVANGHALIHSVRSVDYGPVEQIRRYFADRRAAHPRTR
jgi:hypothetical protein